MKFEDLIEKPLNTYEKICKKLKVKKTSKNFKTKILGKSVEGNSSNKRNKKVNKFGIYKPEGNRFKFDKSVMPEEYWEILKIIKNSASRFNYKKYFSLMIFLNKFYQLDNIN